MPFSIKFFNVVCQLNEPVSSIHFIQIIHFVERKRELGFSEVTEPCEFT